MPEKKLTLNRFPLFGLFAHQAARHMGYPEDDLYKAWRDGNKVGFNRVDLEKLIVWLHEHGAKR